MRILHAPFCGIILLLSSLFSCAPRQSFSSNRAYVTQGTSKYSIDTSTIQGAEMLKYNLTKDGYNDNLAKAKSVIKEYYMYGTPFNVDTCSSFSSLLDSLDPYTRYESLRQHNSSKNARSGNSQLGGFSAYKVDSSKCAVERVVYKSPAWRAGLAVDDEIRSINLKSCKSLSAAQVMNIIDTIQLPIKLVVRRITSTDTVFVHIKLKDIDYTNYSIPVSLMLPKNIGYIKISNFADGVGEKFQKDLTKLVNNGMKQLILDLRNNPGGVVDEALCVANQFLPPGTIISIEKGKGITKVKAPDSPQGSDFGDTCRAHREALPGIDNVHGFSFQDNPFRSVEGSTFLTGEIIVLVNGNTASAAELLAGALHSNKRALLIGDPTHGKGRIQRYFKLPNNDVLRVSIGEYLFGNGLRIDKYFSRDSVGLRPDISLDRSPYPELSNAYEQKISREVASWFEDLGEFRRSLSSGTTTPPQLCQLWNHPLYARYLANYAWFVYGAGYAELTHAESLAIQKAWQTLISRRATLAGTRPPDIGRTE